MTHNTLPLLLAACLGVCVAAPAQAQEIFDFENIDSILEENTLTEVSNRYAATLQTFLPEHAARLGFASSSPQLNDRSSAAQTQTLRALNSVRQKLKDVHTQNLSESKQVDFRLLQNAIDEDLRRAGQTRHVKDPLYYTEAFDAIYNVFIDQVNSPAKKRADIAALLTALPATAEQAEKTLSNPSAFLAQLAMEKAYYAYLSFDELTDFLLQGEENEFAFSRKMENIREAKRAVKRMFDLFKRLSQEETSQDFRLGEEAYTQLLAQAYQINLPADKLIKKAETNTKKARQQLSAALEPFFAQMEEDEITLVEDLNAAPQAAAKPKPVKKKSKKAKPVLRNAQDFYAAAKRIAAPQTDNDLTAFVQAKANEAANEFAQKNILPGMAEKFTVLPMPRYYAYAQATGLWPAYDSSSPKLLLRLPFGNSLAKEEQLKRDFNEPALKLMIAKQLVPGGYYQNTTGKNWSAWRRTYPSATTANGWEEYGAWLAKEKNYIVTDEDLVYYAWDGYRRALAAETDAKMQTKRFSYTDALNYLTQENGLEQAEAEQMLKDLASRAGEAVSRQEGLEVWQNAHEKFRKKLGKKFNEADFHKKALLTGNVPPADVEKEISRLYEKEKRQAKKKDFF